MPKTTFVVLSAIILARVTADPVSWRKEFEDTPVAGDDVAYRNSGSQYRLPKSVVPLEYNVYIDIYFDENTNRSFSYEGKVYINVRVLEENVTQIILHSNVDHIHSISFSNEAGIHVPLNTSQPFSIEHEYHFLKINTHGVLNISEIYTLFIEYSSTMNDGPMKRGIWRGWYIDPEGIERVYAATHFQPYNARQAFPCWDEPFFKATFQLHLSVPYYYSGVFSNTGVEIIDLLGGGRVRYNFFPTPKMSSYLLTFLASESFQVIAQDTSLETPVRIIGNSKMIGLGNHSLNLAVKMTKYYDEYFGISYSSMHQHLFNDHVASPDWASAGTENWGMVSYRELYLIIDPTETIMSVEHYAATLVSHELAHKWFGNLITCNWWSNTWINEGFASYFGYIATNEMFPEYELDDHFNSRYLQNSLSFDSSAGTVPLNHDVNTPAQVTGHFGTISYSKGAAFLRMTADIVSLETFRKACQYFLQNNAYEPTDQHDLHDALIKAIEQDNSLQSYSNVNFTDYYRIWVNEPGYPVLNVDINHLNGTILLSQERFFISATTSPGGVIYPIPITYSSKSNPNFSLLKPLYIMTSKEAALRKVEGEEWVIFNNLQHGHYRVNYDDRTWNLITEALLNEPDQIHYLNRAQIVDDVFALMRSGRITYAYGFRILRFLRNEIDYHVWDAAITGYTWLRNRLRHIPAKQAAFDSFVLSYMERVIQFVGFDGTNNETPTTSLTRQDVLHFASLLKHDICMRELRQRFIFLRNNDNWVSPRIRRNVYVVGIREGRGVDFDFLLERYQSSNLANEQLEILRALAATKEEENLTRYLELTLTKFVRSHDKVNAFNYALLGNQENAYTVLQFVKNNIDAIREAYIEDAPPNPVHTALSNLAAYLDEPGLVEFEDWLRTTQTGTAQYNSALNAISSARANMAWGTANADNILAAARDSAVRAAVSSIVILFATSVVLLFTTVM